LKLRDYQTSAVAGIRTSMQSGHKRPLLVAPTGAGKTAMFSYIARGVATNNKRVLILAHRRELLKQISDALYAWGVGHGMLLGGQVGLPRSNVVVASVNTIVNRLRHFTDPDLIICDEAHHVTPDSMFGKVIAHFPRSLVLGVTATPCRLDGRGLGEVFDDMVMGPTVAELIALGYLCPVDVYAPSTPNLTGVKRRAGDYVQADLEAVMDKPTITGHAVEHYRRLALGKRAVAFCVSIKHAHDVAEEFRAAGFRAASVDGKMEDGDRDRVIDDFKRGKIDVLASCSLISEGFDLPDIECGIMLRPTQSVSLFIQQAGRIIRIAPGKQRAILIDHAGNTHRHGFIDTPREWTLDSAAEAKSGSGDAVPRVRTCQVCFTAHKPSPVCPKCGHVYEINGRVVDHVDGELVQVSSAEDYATAPDESEYVRYYYIMKNVGRRNAKIKDPQQWAFHHAATKLANDRAKARGNVDGTVNGLLPEEYEDLRARTIERDRVMTAMSNEEKVA
jgi:DNA repair protein RadD